MCGGNCKNGHQSPYFEFGADTYGPLGPLATARRRSPPLAAARRRSLQMRHRGVRRRRWRSAARSSGPDEPRGGAGGGLPIEIHQGAGLQ